MDPASDPRPAAPSRRVQRLTLLEVMLLVAGLALGLWLFGVAGLGPGGQREAADAFGIFLGVLGGLSLIGPPLLLLERRRGRPRWGAGKMLWFSTGTAAWLMWPPAIYRRASGDFGNSETAVCFAYGTPLMALYVTLALLAGGWFGRRRRRRLRRSWREVFGLLLGLAWASTGLYLLSMFWAADLRR